MTASLKPATQHDLPASITAPGETEVLMTVMAAFLVLAVPGVCLLFLRIHVPAVPNPDARARQSLTS
ncbi:hypothetical protein [Microvirga calopogonii]|uniref:hypothetical protein n=1 Tax=Microvirga calopogonii TaxID=2078013 RepID=UPI000E0DA16B|nr:hypothetical protein [Microvirga calopogonii]